MDSGGSSGVRNTGWKDGSRQSKAQSDISGLAGSGPNIGSSGGSGNSGSNNVQFVPIMVICCPNLLKNEPCYCGHQSFVTIPSQL